MTVAKQRNTALALLAALAIIVFSGAVIWVGSLGEEWYHFVLVQIGTAVIVAAGLGLLWDVWGKRLLADEIFEKMKVGQAVSRWGLRELSMAWTEQPWPALFAKGPNVDLMVGYAQTWRGVAFSGLEDFLAERENTLRVCLPDPSLEWLMVSLGHRYNLPPERVSERIRDAARYFAKLRDTGEATVQIFFRPGQPLYGLYRFESVAIVTLYPHRKEKSSKIPTMTMETGEMVQWLKEDFEAALRDAREVSDNEFQDDTEESTDASSGGSTS